MREGVTVTPETLAAIESAQGADATVPLNPDARLKFLLAYSEVARLASPVSAQSLRDCSDDFPTLWKRWPWSEPRKVSQADKAVLRHHTWGSVALAVLLAAFGGSTIETPKKSRN